MKTKPVDPVSFVGSPLFICRIGEDQSDCSLSSRIAQEASAFLTPKCLTVDELIVKFPWNVIPGIILIIVSQDLLADRARCTAISELITRNCRQTFMPHYCICRGITVSAVQNHPNFTAIVENLIIYDEEQVSRLLTHLRHYVMDIMPTLTANQVLSIREGLKFGFDTICMFVYAVVLRLFRKTLVAAFLLAFCLWRGWHYWWCAALAAFCAFGAGFRLNFLNSSDLWPWLGRRWKFSRLLNFGSNAAPLVPTGMVFGLGVALALLFSRQKNWLWAGLVAVAGAVGQKMLDSWSRRQFRNNSVYSEAARRELNGLAASHSLGSVCQLDQLKAAALHRLFTCYWSMLATACRVVVQLYPAILFAKRGIDQYVWVIAAAGIVGLLAPPVLGDFVRRAMATGGGGLGLTKHHSSILKPLIRSPAGQLKLPQPALDRPDLKDFDADEQAQVFHWLEFLRLPVDRFPMRSWRARKDYAFISYPWRDDSELQVSSGIARALEVAGVEHFIDKMNFGRDAGWYRMPLAVAICKSTHFFLVISPNIVSGRVITKEIELAMGRWPMEMLPTIICVVEPDTAQRLRANRDVPLALRFLITFCPNITYAESAQPAIVRWILEFTRRRGKLDDWWPLLSPATSFLEAVRLPGIMEACPTPPAEGAE